ncbi:MAG: hypothetical protein ABEJ55_03805, partial [Halanaeroarchaeum sp.]
WNAQIIGLDNYVQLLHDGEFIYSSAFAVALVVTVVVIEFVIGFVLALLCQGDFFGKKAFILALLTPLMVMPVVTGNTFYLFFRPNGLINATLTSITGSPVIIPWLSSFPLAVVPIIVADVWHW